MSCILKLLETIYSNSAHQGVIGIVNAEKRLLLNITFSGVDGNSGVHRHLEGQGWNGVTRAKSRSGVGGRGVVSPWLGVSRFTILSRFFVMLFFLFCKLFEHYSQTYFPIRNTKPFKVTKYLKITWKIFRPKWVNIKIFVILFYLCYKKMRNKIHITNRHNIQIMCFIFR